jgi:hypothetical protein
MSSRSNSVVYSNAKGKRLSWGVRRRGVGVLELQCCDAGRIQTIEWAAHRAGHSVAKPASPLWDDTCIASSLSLLHRVPSLLTILAVMTASDITNPQLFWSRRWWWLSIARGKGPPEDRFSRCTLTTWLSLSLRLRFRQSISYFHYL